MFKFSCFLFLDRTTRMKSFKKYRQLFDNYKFEGDKNSFYGCIWMYSKVLHTLGHFPFKVFITNDKVDFNECNASLAHFMIIFILSAFYVGYSHFAMKHNLHHMKHSMIARVSMFQIMAVTFTGVIGAFNSIFMRKNMIKVWIERNWMKN